MTANSGAVAVAVVCLGLAACHLPGIGGKKAPTGEVAATVDGQEITVRDLRAEMAGAKLVDPNETKRVEQQALQRIIARTLLARAARDQGIDKTPDFAVARQRAMDTLLAQALEARIAGSVPAPTREETESFVSGHPDIFAKRKIFSVDQVRIAQPSDPKVLRDLKPLKTIDGIIALLDRDQIKFERSDARLDAVGADPRLIEAVVKLPPHEVFVLPANGLVVINQIKDTRVEPFTGKPALAYALNLLKRQHAREAVRRQLDALVAQKAKSVRYNQAFQPAAPAGTAANPT